MYHQTAIEALDDITNRVKKWSPQTGIFLHYDENIKRYWAHATEGERIDALKVMTDYACTLKEYLEEWDKPIGTYPINIEGK